MPDANDMSLVREFVLRSSEAAFAELVRRHLGLVYSVALRITGNAGDAQDVAQAVFIVLARKAAALGERTVLTGWLYEATRFTAARFVRTQIRRQAREQEALVQSTLNDSSSDSVWRQLAPHLEAAMSRLSERDRTLLALRFYENKTAAEAAAQLAIREDAAHKRTARALEKLRAFFSRRGIALSAAAIAGAVSAHSVEAAPLGLAQTVTALAAAKGAAASASTLTLVKGAITIMAWTKTKTVIVAGAVVFLMAGSTAALIETYRQAKRVQDERAHEGKTAMSLAGTPGAVVTGFYTQNGRKIALSNSLPWSFAATNISHFELRKANPEDTVQITLSYDGQGMHSRMTQKLDAKFLWLEGRVKNGLTVVSHPAATPPPR